MKSVLIFIIVIIILSFIPIIPYEKKLNNGAVSIESKPVIDWIIEQHKLRQVSEDGKSLQ